jgi:hypothetical protein
MMASRINGFSVAYTIAGAVILWSGVSNNSISATLRDILSGKSPANVPESLPNEAATSTATTSTATTVSGNYSLEQLESLWTSLGGSASSAYEAAQVALSESSGNPNATSANPDGGENVGLWQLDTKGVGAGYTVAQLQSPTQNAIITIMATGNGANWSEWSDSVVQNGVYVGPKGP